MCTFSKKGLLGSMAALFLSAIISLFCFSTAVYAGNPVSVVMRYNAANYSKTIYDVEVDMIKAGTVTDGLRQIGEMCDNVAVISGGADKVNKQAVMSVVASQIQAGAEYISIDLTKYLSSGSAAVSADTAQVSGSISDAAGIPIPGDTVSGPATVPALAPVPKPMAYSAAMCNYYARSVFIGDSLMVGFRNYAANAKTSYINKANFLCAGSYSLRNALVQGSKLHPTYKGKKRPVWESIAEMDVDRVFIMFGMNDISIVGTDKSCENYVSLISKIKQAKPGIEINIISMTNVLAGHEGKGLNNAAVRDFNTKLAALCSTNGWGFCNLAPLLVDENGALASVYCSDHFVHHTNKAYSEAWESFFYQYALSKGVK